MINFRDYFCCILAPHTKRYQTIPFLKALIQPNISFAITPRFRRTVCPIFHFSLNSLSHQLCMCTGKPRQGGWWGRHPVPNHPPKHQFDVLYSIQLVNFWFAIWNCKPCQSQFTLVFLRQVPSIFDQFGGIWHDGGYCNYKQIHRQTRLFFPTAVD